MCITVYRITVTEKEKVTQIIQTKDEFESWI